MGRTLVGAIGVGWLCLVVAACGGGSAPSQPSADEIEACLNGAGLAAESIEKNEGVEAIGAAAPDGDLILVITQPKEVASNPDLPGMVTDRIKKELRKLGRAGVWTSDTVNGGSTYVGVLGVKGVGGGLASASTEILARQCATRPRVVNAKDTAAGTEA
jgi:hypothetical protein